MHNPPFPPRGDPVSRLAPQSSVNLSHWSEPATVLTRLIRKPWALERKIPGLASMMGTARFYREGDHFRYRETGLLTLTQGDRFAAQREYLYAQLPDGFAVYFKELPIRLFQTVRLTFSGSVLRGVAAHECSPDHYFSCYTFEPDGTFHIHHRVDGPRKHYDIITRFLGH